MSKRILLLFVSIMITMQTNFAMELQKSSANITSFIGKRFSNDLIIHRLSPLHYAEKKSQALQQQLHDLALNQHDLEQNNDQIVHVIQKNADAISRNEKIQIVCLTAGVMAEILTGGISGGTLSSLGFGGATVKQSANMELSDCIQHNKSKLNENNSQLDRINHDAAKIKFELTKLNERKNTFDKEKLAQQIKDGKIKVINISYHRPIDDVTGIDTFSKKSDRIYQQLCESQDPYSDSYHIVTTESDSLDCFPGFWISEDSFDSSMQFCRSDEELSDDSFLLKRSFTKNGNRIVVYFENSFDSTDFISEEEAIVLDRYNLVNNNNDDSSDSVQGPVNSIKRFYHHQYRYYTNKYGYYDKICINYMSLPGDVLGKFIIIVPAAILNYAMLRFFIKVLLSLESTIVENII